MMDYKDKVQVMYQTKDGRYIAILKDDYRLDGSMVIEGDLESVIADVLRADRWVTINGSHVLIGKDGTIMAGMGGKFNGFPFGANFRDKGKTTKGGRKIARLYKAQKGEKTGQKVASRKTPKEKPLQLKGSEKQVKWANDIISEARGTIKANIARNKANIKQYGNISNFTDGLKIWRKIKTAYEKLLTETDKASDIINERTYLNGRAMVAKFNELHAMLQNGKLKL